MGQTDRNVDLDRTDRSQRSRWTGPIGPGNKDGPSRTDRIGSTRLGPKSVGLGRSRSGPDRGCPYLALRAHHGGRAKGSIVSMVSVACENCCSTFSMLERCETADVLVIRAF